MWLLVVCFLLGICLGISLQKKKAFFPYISHGTEWLVKALLFFLGIGLGCNKVILANLASLGLLSLVLTIGAVAGSIFFVWPMQHILRPDKAGHFIEAQESNGDQQ